MMKIEAVTVCVGFADILAHTLTHNQTLFSHWIIVTSHADQATQTVCNRHGLHCVVSDAFTRKGERFNKALGINTGLAHLTCSEWILHLDVDTILPPFAPAFMANAELDTHHIHGIDRFDLTGWDAYQAWKAAGIPQYEWGCLVKPPAGLTFGTRIAHYDQGGYMPIGFFQLWHADSKLTRYPTKANTDAEHTDVLHAMRWPRPKRVLIPEFFALHLESEKVAFGAGWHGRASKRFGPDPAPAPSPSPAPAPPLMAAAGPPIGPPVPYHHHHCHHRER